MKTIKNLFNKVRKNIQKRYLIIGFVVALFAITGMAVKAEYYPARTPYDYNKPCNPNDNDPYDRCGSLTGPVFNSFIHTPSYGDERAFLDARRSDQTASGSYKNVLPDVTEGSKEVVLRTYIHNNANQSTNGADFNGAGVAKDAKIRILLPTATAQALRARSYISAGNATTVEDTVDMIANKEFRVEYIPGSAILYNNGPFKNGTPLANSIVTSGAPIGYNALNGVFPGCFEYEAIVQIRVKVFPKEIPNVGFSKQVAVSGQTSWGEKVSVKPGDNVKWLVSFANKGTAKLNAVTISDKLPPHLKVKHDSVKWIYTGTNGKTQEVTQNDTQFFTTGGIDFGAWNPNGGFYVRFETIAKDDFEGCEVVLRNIAYNNTAQTSRIEDSADVTITKPNCKPPKPNKPVYSCDLLTVEKIGDKKYRYTADATAKDGAKIKMYLFDFGDGTDVFKTDKKTVDHTYANDGNYVAIVKVQVDVEGDKKIAESTKCTQPITFSTTTTTTTTTTTVPGGEGKLADTGPGDVAGIFTGTSLVGMFLHRRWTLRRIGKR